MVGVCLYKVGSRLDQTAPIDFVQINSVHAFSPLFLIGSLLYLLAQNKDTLILCGTRNKVFFLTCAL